MARPEWFPMYVADYDADTADLSLEEDGFYSRMLRRAWSTSDDGSLPADRVKLCRVLGIARIPKGCEAVISRYWRKDRERIFNPRLRAEAHEQLKRSEAAAEKARKRWRGIEPEPPPVDATASAAAGAGGMPATATATEAPERHPAASSPPASALSGSSASTSLIARASAGRPGHGCASEKGRPQ